MLTKFRSEPNDLIRVFDFNGYAMYSLKTSGAFKIDLSSQPDRERLIFSLKGNVLVNSSELKEKDMMYVPIGSKATFESTGESVVFVAETKGSKKFDPYLKKYSEANRMSIGQPPYKRTVVQSITENDPANRFLAGYVEGSMGEWTSYPPHKHDEKPEAYVYYNVDPGFAVQMVLDGDDERAFVVHDYDTVLIPRGYHPEVNTSITAGCYAWIISAPPDARNMQVEIHPAFKNVNLGKSHLTINS